MPRLGLLAASLAWLIASRRAASLMAAPSSCCRRRDRRPITSPNRPGRRRCGLAAAPPPSRTIPVTARCAHRSGIAADRNGHKVNIQHQSVENVEPIATDAPTIIPGLDVPRHVAFICDGNSRWADERGLPESMGHAAGADRVVQLIKALHRRRSSALNGNEDTQSTRQGPNNGERPRQRIEYCTLFAFSTENWSRPRSEINALFKLMERTAGQYRNFDAVREGKVQITVLGDLDDERIPDGARTELRALERESKYACSKRIEEVGSDEAGVLTVCLAINYGGRADILRAAGELAISIASGELPPDAIHDEFELSKRLRTSTVPDPDLIVRTGGERRLSNFLLWDAAYAELYFSDALWPDFDEGALEEALDWYGTRKRRFGGR